MDSKNNIRKIRRIIAYSCLFIDKRMSKQKILANGQRAKTGGEESIGILSLVKKKINSI